MVVIPQEDDIQASDLFPRGVEISLLEKISISCETNRLKK